MSWKSTIDINRTEAIRLILEKIETLDKLSNNDLNNILFDFGYGDDVNLPYYGYNFNILDDNKCEKCD